MKTIVKFGFVSILLALIVSACAAPKPAFRNSAVDPVVKAADFSMPDDNGHAFQLSDQQGKVVLLAFGYTNCPDECPLTMAHIKQALETLGEQAKNVQVVLVTTDPVRDTPQALENYLSVFNPNFIGIPGTAEELDKIYAAYGVIVEDGGETHTAETYIIDKNGNLRLTFVPETEPADLAADLKILLAE